MTAAVIMGGLVLMTAIVTVGVFYIVHSTTKDADTIREMKREREGLISNINTQKDQIRTLQIDLQTERNRIHEADQP